MRGRKGDTEAWKRDRVDQIKRGDGAAFWKYKAGSLNSLATARGGERFVKDYELRAIYERQRGRCYYCEIEVQTGTGRTTRKQSMSFDHVAPGVNAVWNIVMACSTCNTMKAWATLADLERMAAKVRQHMEAHADLYDGAEVTEVIAINTRKAEDRQLDMFGDPA
jgi:hypothetical protein